jgi:hypothetical protein
MSKEDRELFDMLKGEQTEAQNAEPVKGHAVAGKFAKKRNKAELRRVLGEVAGWTGFGAVVLGGMLAGVFPMSAAVPVFIGCFGWVAIRVDRYFRG